jgi:alpha-beta hydrolase superfamily lysophospholipase
MRRDAGRGHLNRFAWVLPGLCCAALSVGCQSLQRKAMFHPTHHSGDNGLARWTHDGSLIGFAREVPSPDNVWLMLHGNGGQAADRVHALPAFPARDSVYILEYPGYGQRAGKPSRKTFDAAALAAYQLLRATHPGKPVCVAAESIGSGPAATLGAMAPPPDKLVFIVPFADLKSVGKDYAPYAPMGLLLAGSWNNVEALARYDGPVDVFGAEGDQVIDVRHARALAASRPQAKFHLLPGGHNEWSRQPGLRIRCP